MCVQCGCDDHVALDGASPPTARARSAGGAAVVSPDGDLHYGRGAAGASVPGMSPVRAVRLEADVLGENARLAARNRAHFAAHGVTAYDLVSSPGSGKTTLLCATVGALRARAPGLPLAIIEGDQQTTLDADRLRASGAEAIQVNTGKGCHLDARMVGDAFSALSLHGEAHADPGAAPAALLLIENVGNLVCPALWDLGEAAKIVVLSVTEGDDKPLKYPDMFAAADLLVINKIDLLPHVDFDVDACVANARRINPDIEVCRVSATTGDGLDGWLERLLRPAAAA